MRGVPVRQVQIQMWDKGQVAVSLTWFQPDWFTPIKETLRHTSQGRQMRTCPPISWLRLTPPNRQFQTPIKRRETLRRGTFRTKFWRPSRVFRPSKVAVKLNNHTIRSGVKFWAWKTLKIEEVQQLGEGGSMEALDLQEAVSRMISRSSTSSLCTVLLQNHRTMFWAKAIRSCELSTIQPVTLKC